MINARTMREVNGVPLRIANLDFRVCTFYLINSMQRPYARYVNVFMEQHKNG